MPVLHVRALPQKDSRVVQDALKRTCLALAETYGCKPEQVWATWDEIKPGLYVEGKNSPEYQPAATHPPIVEVLCFEGKTQDDVERILTTVAQTLSTALGIPNNIFVTYTEARSGRVMAGDGIIRRR